MEKNSDLILKGSFLVFLAWSSNSSSCGSLRVPSGDSSSAASPFSRGLFRDPSPLPGSPSDFLGATASPDPRSCIATLASSSPFWSIWTIRSWTLVQCTSQGKVFGSIYKYGFYSNLKVTYLLIDNLTFTASSHEIRTVLVSEHQKKFKKQHAYKLGMIKRTSKQNGFNMF